MNEKLTDDEISFLIQTTDKLTNPALEMPDMPLHRKVKNPRFIIERFDNGFVVIVLNGIFRKYVAKSYDELEIIIANNGIIKGCV